MTRNSPLPDRSTRCSTYSDRSTRWLTGLPDLPDGAPGLIGNGVSLPIDAPMPKFEMNETVHYARNGTEVLNLNDYLVQDVGYDSELRCLVYRIQHAGAGFPDPAASFLVVDELYLVAGRYRVGMALEVVLQSGYWLGADVIGVFPKGRTAKYKILFTGPQWVPLVDIIQYEAMAVGNHVLVKLKYAEETVRARILELPQPGSTPVYCKLSFAEGPFILHENTAYRKL